MEGLRGSCARWVIRPCFESSIPSSSFSPSTPSETSSGPRRSPSRAPAGHHRSVCMCARVCARCNPIFRFNLFTPPLASLRPNLPRVVNTFARIPGPFCPGRARSPLQSPPLSAALCRRNTAPLSLPPSRAHSPPLLLFLLLPYPYAPHSHPIPLSPTLSSLQFDNPTRHRNPVVIMPGLLWGSAATARWTLRTGAAPPVAPWAHLFTTECGACVYIHA